MATPSTQANTGQHANNGSRSTGTSSGPSGGSASAGLPPDFQAFAHLPGIWFRETEVVPLTSQNVRWDRLVMEVVTPQGQQIVMHRTHTWPPLACGTPLGHWSEIRECVVTKLPVHETATLACRKCGHPAMKQYTAQRYDIYGQSIPVCFNCLAIIDAPTLWEQRWARIARRLGKGVWW